MSIGKISIIPTNHYLEYHSDVDWCLVILTILSPDKTHPNKRHGKNRFTYIKRFRKYIIEVHIEKDNVESKIYVINAFQMDKDGN